MTQDIWKAEVNKYKPTSYFSPFCDTCNQMRRLCAMCGVGPILEGWLADDEYYCDTCNPVDISCYDNEGELYTGVTLSQCYDLLGGDYADNDCVYHTTWEEVDSCRCGPFPPQIIRRGC
jgi:hypothetical protein